jgi:hypothetical protein
VVENVFGTFSHKFQIYQVALGIAIIFSNGFEGPFPQDEADQSSRLVLR